MKNVSNTMRMALLSLRNAMQQEEIDGYSWRTWDALIRRGLVRWSAMSNMGYILTAKGRTYTDGIIF